MNQNTYTAPAAQPEKPKRNTTLIVIIVLLVLALSTSPATYAVTPAAAPPQQGPDGGIQSAPINLGAGTRVQLRMTDQPPELTEAQKAALAQRDARGPLPAASPLPVGTYAADRPDSVRDPNKAIDPSLRQVDRSPSAAAAPGDASRTLAVLLAESGRTEDARQELATSEGSAGAARGTTRAGPEGGHDECVASGC